jgi:chorismate synthase
VNNFGTLFKVQIFGESHGDCVGITIDGCLAGLPLSVEDFFIDIERRKEAQKELPLVKKMICLK